MNTKQKPFLPEATAMWLIKNTKLTFEQIAEFSHLHIVTVKSMSDGAISRQIREVSPIANGQLTQEEIDRCKADPSSSLVLQYIPSQSSKEVKSYVPLVKRQDKAKAIGWLLKHYPKIKDSQIVKLVKCSNASISTTRRRSHLGSETPLQSPAELGFCSKREMEKILGDSPTD